MKLILPVRLIKWLLSFTKTAQANKVEALCTACDEIAEVQVNIRNNRELYLKEAAIAYDEETRMIKARSKTESDLQHKYYIETRDAMIDLSKL